MQKVVTKFNIISFLIVLPFLINLGCGISILEENQTIDSNQLHKSKITIVDTSDVAKPTIAGSLDLPFRVNKRCTVVNSGKFVFLTTENHLHVIDVSNIQKPTYITSLNFSNDLGQMRVSNNQAFIESGNKIHIIDVSNPIKPVKQLSVNLHPSNVIEVFDIHKSYLYIMDTYNYIHIYSLNDDNVQFIETVGTTNPSSLVGVKAKGAGIEKIVLKYITPGDIGWLELEDRTDLIELSGRYNKVRVSEDNLVLARRRFENREVEIIDKVEKYGPASYPVWVEKYNVMRKIFAYLYLSGQKQMQNGNPYDLIGWTTDFQVSQNMLYATNAKGFLSIIDLKTEKQHRDIRYISGIKIQDQYPISIALGSNYVCVLTSPEDTIDNY